MKKGIFIFIILSLLFGFSIYFKSQSSYTSYKKLKNKNKHEEIIEETNEKIDVEKNNEKTPKDIALDKRLNEERKKNEKTYEKQGITGTSIRPSKKQPSFSLDDWSKIISLLQVYMKENSDKFPKPSDNTLINRTSDPRINERLYDDTKKGIIKDYENENLIAMEIKKLDGKYTIIILGKKNKDSEWEILSEGDVYKLRKEISDGN